LDWAGLVQAGLDWAGLGWAGPVWAATGTVLGSIEVAKGHGGKEAPISRLDCVSFETGLSIPHKPNHRLLVFV